MEKKWYMKKVLEGVKSDIRPFVSSGGINSIISG